RPHPSSQRVEIDRVWHLTPERGDGLGRQTGRLIVRHRGLPELGARNDPLDDHRAALDIEVVHARDVVAGPQAQRRRFTEELVRQRRQLDDDGPEHVGMPERHQRHVRVGDDMVDLDLPCIAEVRNRSRNLVEPAWGQIATVPPTDGLDHLSRQWMPGMKAHGCLRSVLPPLPTLARERPSRDVPSCATEIEGTSTRLYAWWSRGSGLRSGPG